MKIEKRSFLFGFVSILCLCVVPVVGDLIIQILDTFKKEVWNPVVSFFNRFSAEKLHEKDIDDFNSGKTKRNPGSTFIYTDDGVYIIDSKGDKTKLR